MKPADRAGPDSTRRTSYQNNPVERHVYLFQERSRLSFVSGTAVCQDLRVQPLSRTYKGATPRQRVEQRRALLVDAAVDVFGTIGYRAATVDHVCARAGLSKRYFYES